MSESENPQIEWAPCNGCRRQTRHGIVAERELEEDVTIGGRRRPLHITDTYTMLECMGCGSIILRHRSTCPQTRDDDFVVFYPQRRLRRIPDWQIDLPSEFKSLLRETYTALNANSFRLAVMGARALVDMFINETVGDVGGFAAKLSKLVETGDLSKKEKDILAAALDTGHAVIHRGHNPSGEDVKIVFDIVENLLQKLALGKQVKNLKRHTPKRRAGAEEQGNA